MISGVLKFWELACPLGVLDTGMDTGILGPMVEQWDFVRVVSWGMEREEEVLLRILGSHLHKNSIKTL